MLELAAADRPKAAESPLPFPDDATAAAQSAANTARGAWRASRQSEGLSRPPVSRTDLRKRLLRTRAAGTQAQELGGEGICMAADAAVSQHVHCYLTSVVTGWQPSFMSSNTATVAMDVYLIQHGLAESKDRDPARPLTPNGRSQALGTATRVAELGLEVGAVWHSGKLRAQETAEIFAEQLRPTQGVIEHEGMAPLDDPGIIAREIGEPETPVMLVGHLPHLSRLASLLVTGDADREIVAFRNAGVVCLGRGAPGWRAKWIITPDLV